MFPLSVVRYVFYEIVVIIVPQIVVLILHKPGRAVGVFLAVASVYGLRHKQLDGSARTGTPMNIPRAPWK